MVFRPTIGRLLTLALPCSALALSSMGCTAAEVPEDEPVGIYGAPIKGGYNDSVDTAVVGIYDYSVGAICSRGYAMRTRCAAIWRRRS